MPLTPCMWRVGIRESMVVGRIKESESRSPFDRDWESVYSFWLKLRLKFATNLFSPRFIHSGSYI